MYLRHITRGLVAIVLLTAMGTQSIASAEGVESNCDFRFLLLWDKRHGSEHPDGLRFGFDETFARYRRRCLRGADAGAKAERLRVALGQARLAAKSERWREQLQTALNDLKSEFPPAVASSAEPSEVIP